ncbi:MAG TPA: methylated-DNA--[protein]-cysteine S-methyltransferase [Candidatus Binatia bacterium]|nr:methylated-DNA--[protein]-cysteine S-methyltransferase [Candidatus Binatia bacterium]
MNFKDLLISAVSVREDSVEDLLRRSRPLFEEAFDGVRRPEAALAVVNSSLGDLLVATSTRGLVLVHFIDDANDLTAALANLRLAFDPIASAPEVSAVGEEVRRYLGGDANALRQKIDLSLVGSSFQSKVLEKLQGVPRGAVISYQALGAALGAPNAARAVGNALHHNPLPIYVPCHRIIASSGRLGGYGGGAARKLQLLRSEGFSLAELATKLPANAIWAHSESKIYCRRNCPSAARANRARMMFFAGAEEALRAGMRPCKTCRPPVKPGFRSWA